MKTCTKCLIEKSLKEFYQTNTTKDGYTYNCISCYQLYRDEHKERQRVYMQNLRLLDNEKVNSYKRRLWREKNPVDKVLEQSRSRAKRKGIEHNITKEDIENISICPLLNLPLIAGNKKNYEQSPSLDRIDPNKGYIKGNVWLLSKRANTMKSNASKEELLVFALNIIKHFGDIETIKLLKKNIKKLKK